MNQFKVPKYQEKAGNENPLVCWPSIIFRKSERVNRFQCNTRSWIGFILIPKQMLLSWLSGSGFSFSQELSESNISCKSIKEHVYRLYKETQNKLLKSRVRKLLSLSSSLTEEQGLRRTYLPPDTCLLQIAKRDGRKFQRRPFSWNQVCSTLAQPIIAELFWGESMPERLKRERCAALSDKCLDAVKFHKCCKGSKLQLRHDRGFLATFPTASLNDLNHTVWGDVVGANVTKGAVSLKHFI